MLDALAVVFEKPEQITLSRLPLAAPEDDSVVLRTLWSGISTGTERLLYRGRMPSFPGLAYPLVPGYETVGTVIAAGPASAVKEGAQVFVPGARCFGEVRGLFGGAASQIVTSASRVTPVSESLGENAILLALAATAYHALGEASSDSDLVVGHGVLGRLIARLLCLKNGAPPIVWESDARRSKGGAGYDVLSPTDDRRSDYRRIFDASGDAALLDELISRLAPGGELVLTGFYADRVSFAYPRAFMREARIRVAAEWQPNDLVAVKALVEDGSLSLDGLITHRHPAGEAARAYATAFDDPSCLKMILDWRQGS